MGSCNWKMFRAGAVDLLYAEGDLRYLRAGGVEVLRRIYVGVRDGAWGTVPGTIRDLVHQQDEDGFRISYVVEHRQGDIAFTWRARIEGRSARVADGTLDVTISFIMDGEAQSTFRTNRTGFCVLHPIEGCAGRECTVERADGGTQRGAFPRLIAPDQPLTNIRAMRYEPVAGLQVEVRFEGDVFEMEDQRNWTDGSYKTYCRPLSLPFPYELAKGQRVRQGVTVRVRGRMTADLMPQSTITIGKAIGNLPRLGLRASSGWEPMDDQEARRLRRLNLSHLRVDLRPGRDARQWVQQTTDGDVLSLPLEVAMHLPEHQAEKAAESMAAWLEVMRSTAITKARPDVARLIVYRDRRPFVAPEDVEMVRRVLWPREPVPPIGGGTIGNFAELNRSRSIAGMQVLAYPINPQIHAMDDWSVMENLQGQADTVATARAFAPGVRLAVGPVMLHRRPDPFAAGKSGMEEEGSGDPRQKGLFGAAWTVGSIKYLAEAGADSITYYETIGEFGVMDGGRVFPLYHVLADVGQFAGGQVMAVRSSSPLVVTALALRDEGRMRILLANLTGSEQRVTLAGLTGEWLVKVLDEQNADQATAEPEQYRKMAGDLKRCGTEALELDMDAYAVVRLDGRAMDVNR